jgi:hypothetical protein
MSEATQTCVPYVAIFSALSFSDDVAVQVYHLYSRSGKPSLFSPYFMWVIESSSNVDVQGRIQHFKLGDRT